MGSSILGGAAALLLLLYWTLRRRNPPVLLRSTDASAVASLNRAQIALLRARPGDSGGVGDPSAGPAHAPSARLDPDCMEAAPIPPAGDARQRAQLKAHLERQLCGDGPQRLQAMRTARRWGHPAALPVLRRGLRDVDPNVVLEAARGLDRFRRCPAAAAVASPQLPLPRNVSRTR